MVGVVRRKAPGLNHTAILTAVSWTLLKAERSGAKPERTMPKSADVSCGTIRLRSRG